MVRAVDGVSFSIDRGSDYGRGGRERMRQECDGPLDHEHGAQAGRTVGGEVLYHRREENGDGEGSEEIIDLLTLQPMGSTMRSIRGGEFAMIFQEPRASLSPVHSIGTQIIEAILLHRPMSKAEDAGMPSRCCAA